jgi:hypothetical protein
VPLKADAHVTRQWGRLRTQEEVNARLHPEKQPSAILVCSAAEIQTLLTVCGANIPASSCEDMDWHARIAD